MKSAAHLNIDGVQKQAILRTRCIFLHPSSLIMVYFLVIWVALLSAFSPGHADCRNRAFSTLTSRISFVNNCCCFLASPVFESCQLRRNFSIAKIQPPQPENSMYGCEMDGWSRREYNFLSCYDSADGNGIVNVNVEFAEGYLIAGVFRLLVVSYKPLLWRVKTNRDIQLAFLTWVYGASSSCLFVRFYRLSRIRH